MCNYVKMFRSFACFFVKMSSKFLCEFPRFIFRFIKDMTVILYGATVPMDAFADFDVKMKVTQHFNHTVESSVTSEQYADAIV